MFESRHCWTRNRTLPVLATILLTVCLARLQADEVFWIEDFSDDPLVAGRFAVPAHHDVGRFTHNPVAGSLTVHYDTLEPTAWYMRPIDPLGGRSLGRYDDFEFTVEFRVHSAGFFADPAGFAQLAWGLINSQTTGEDRAGGSAGPYAYDCLTFDLFPNVSPLYGGPTLGTSIIHSEDGAGFFANIDFPFGAESTIDQAFGDESVELDTTYTAAVTYDGLAQVATITIDQVAGPLLINADGSGGYGGFDGDATTIQTFIWIDNAFTLDTFALTAWQDTFSPFYASVIADVEFTNIALFAPAVMLGDMNHDGELNGRDVTGFAEAVLDSEQNPGQVARGDFNGDNLVDLADLGLFVETLLQP